MAANTLLVDGTDLRSLAYFRVLRMQLRSPGIRRGNMDTIPNSRGQVGAELVYDAYRFSVFGRLFGATREAYNDAQDSLGAVLAGTGGLVTLTRRLASTSGPGYKEHTASGAFVGGLQPNDLNHLTGLVELQFWNNDGCWFDASAPTVPIVP